MIPLPFSDGIPPPRRMPSEGGGYCKQFLDNTHLGSKKELD